MTGDVIVLAGDARPLTYGLQQVAHVDLSDDPPAEKVWRQQLISELAAAAARDGYVLRGDVRFHTPAPAWWVDLPGPDGETVPMLVGEHLARFHTHTMECRTVPGTLTCADVEDLGKPAAYLWWLSADVIPDDA